MNTADRTTAAAISASLRSRLTSIRSCAAAPISSTSGRRRSPTCWKRIHFAPASGRDGPFDLHLAIGENRLSLDIRSQADGSSETIVVPLAPFRGIVKDYFMVCESYYQAVRDSRLAQVEAIDMGRRSLHDEGSELLMERLADKVAIDHATARRLFTLICVLHLRG